MDHWILSYKSPAEAWNEALPLGNGTLGVMSYGRLENETLELNLDTLWSGDGSAKLNKNGHADLGHLRKLDLRTRSIRKQKIIVGNISWVTGRTVTSRLADSI